MLKLRHTTLIIISGMVWMGVGIFLLTLGLGLLVKGSIPNEFDGSLYPLISALSSYIGGSEQAVLAIVVLGLGVGYFKGKFVLSKSAHRSMRRIQTFPNPTSLSNIYSGTYYLLLGFMVALGMSIKYLGFPSDIRGAIDVAVGSALMNGAMIYFRSAAAYKQAS